MCAGDPSFICPTRLSGPGPPTSSSRGGPVWISLASWPSSSCADPARGHTRHLAPCSGICPEGLSSECSVLRTEKGLTVGVN